MRSLTHPFAIAMCLTTIVTASPPDTINPSSNTPEFMSFKPAKEIPIIPLAIQIEAKQRLNVLNNNKPIRPFNKMSPALADMLETMQTNPDFTTDNSLIEVVISIPDTDSQFPLSALNAMIMKSSAMKRDEYGNKYYFNNGQMTNENEIRQITLLQEEANRKSREAINLVHHRHLTQLALDNPNLFDAASFQTALKEKKGFFSIHLKKNEINAFIQKNANHIIVADLPKTVQYSSMDTALSSTRITPDAFAVNATGSGIKVFKVDAWCPQTNYYETGTTFQPFATNYTNLDNSTIYDNHGTLVAAIIRKAAPGAQLYCHRESNSLTSTATYLDFLSTNTSYHLQNHSWNTEYPTYVNNTYSDVDMQFDNFIYNYPGISIFAAAGNTRNDVSNLNVLSPAKAMNVISVGNYDDTSNTINPTSLYINPDTLAQKPEISAPGTNVSYSITDPRMPPEQHDISGIAATGTSFAAPFAAAFAADAMSIEPELLTSSAALKAYMIASATKPISGGEDKVGEGGIEFQDANINIVKTVQAPLASSAFQDYGLQCIRELVTLNEGAPTRVVLSWLNRGSHVMTQKRVGLRLKLFIWSYDDELWYYNQGDQYYTDNPYDILTFSAATNSDPGTTSPYYVYMCNMDTYDTQSKLDMGLAVHQE